MCSKSNSTPVNCAGEKSPLTGSGILKPQGQPCIDCGDYSCCCIPIPCVIM